MSEERKEFEVNLMGYWVVFVSDDFKAAFKSSRMARDWVKLFYPAAHATDQVQIIQITRKIPFNE
jgi:hypothetical protein